MQLSKLGRRHEKLQAKQHDFSHLYYFEHEMRAKMCQTAFGVRAGKCNSAYPILQHRADIETSIQSVCAVSSFAKRIKPVKFKLQFISCLRDRTFCTGSSQKPVQMQHF
jgi:hypothetical protein